MTVAEKVQLLQGTKAAAGPDPEVPRPYIGRVPGIERLTKFSSACFRIIFYWAILGTIQYRKTPKTPHKKLRGNIVENCVCEERSFFS